ncbi:MAG: hypothetical protein R2698_12215 [Microthrixaceae bacterium]
MGVAMVVAGGWWVALVSLWPASRRPWFGGSQDNTFWNVLFGYNGLGRLTGNEAGSVVPGGNRGGQGGVARWGETGITRLFSASFGAQASWLIPTALLGLGAGLVWTWRRPRTDRTRAAALLWGGWLVLSGLVFSLSKGIIHEYYTVALGPAIGAGRRRCDRGVAPPGPADRPHRRCGRDDAHRRVVLRAPLQDTGVGTLVALGRPLDRSGRGDRVARRAGRRPRFPSLGERSLAGLILATVLAGPGRMR